MPVDPAPVRVEWRTELDPAEAFAKLTAWQDHAVPLTRITVTDDGFVARTGLGPLGFDDPMVITELDPPHRVVLQKRGRVVLGWARIEVEAVPGGSLVTWTEQLRVRGVPRFAAPISAAATRTMTRHLLRGLLTQAD